MVNPLRAPMRQLLKEKPLLGTFLKLGQREVVEICARSGFDFAICDLEHSQITEHGAETVILSGIAVGLPIVVRVPSLDPGIINRLLEAGAAGIQVPQLTSSEQVKTLRAAVRYPPEGERSISLAQPAAGYGAEPLLDYIRRANDEILIVGQIESDCSAESLASLISGLDVAFIGTLDLSVALGVPGQATHSTVQARIAEIGQAARKVGVALGIYADTPTAAANAFANGYRYIAVSSDLGILQKGARSLLQQVRETAGRP
jgi:2-keto-3-deoxy-L-rhamnonate aldolase RhmA